MPFVKGQSGNPKGWPKGKKQEKTLAWEALIDNVLSVQTERVNEFLSAYAQSDDEEDHRKFLDYYFRLLEYIKPKQARVEHQGETKQEISVLFITKDTPLMDVGGS